METTLKLSIEIDFTYALENADADYSDYTNTDWENHFKNIVKEQLEEVESWGAKLFIKDENGIDL